MLSLQEEYASVSASSGHGSSNPAGTVVLGLPGATLLEPQESPYVTQAGGMPTFPGSNPPIKQEDLRCSECQNPLSLVLQVWVAILSNISYKLDADTFPLIIGDLKLV